ncbi:hypothetical protein STTU_0814 [Streptomyces sp. Tu6071]|uniref:hypothetical protein n=1 Tax=Streptomyces sp. Tu6071 TaxID=355249 RepID=UPI00020E545D|nr:hypothetical protein [Streptomyces sp. Tu6071]EGJ73603.1 hypothetical protein STTU_0814 [Streptomyces sp. Tu6071]
MPAFALLTPSPAPVVASSTPARTYDSARQLNVTAFGSAVVDTPGVLFGDSMTINSSGSKKDDD